LVPAQSSRQVVTRSSRTSKSMS